jgi:hypothetical protein
MVVVQVREVWVLVPQLLVPVPMGMGFGNQTFMVMLMMGIVDMGVVVFQLIVDVIVGVVFGEVKPEASGHQ